MIATREWTKQVSIHRSTIQQWKQCVTHVHLDEVDIVQRGRQQSCMNAACSATQKHTNSDPSWNYQLKKKKCNRQSEYPMRRHWVISVEHTSVLRRAKSQKNIQALLSLPSLPCKSPTLFLGSTDCLDILLLVRLPVYRAARALHRTWDEYTQSIIRISSSLFHPYSSTSRPPIIHEL
jgi:hypothetical protein